MLLSEHIDGLGLHSPELFRGQTTNADDTRTVEITRAYNSGKSEPGQLKHSDLLLGGADLWERADGVGAASQVLLHHFQQQPALLTEDHLQMWLSSISTGILLATIPACNRYSTDVTPNMHGLEMVHDAIVTTPVAACMALKYTALLLHRIHEKAELNMWNSNDLSALWGPVLFRDSDTCSSPDQAKRLMKWVSCCGQGSTFRFSDDGADH